jgi:predicted nuclease of predicted toxin-antitoxin system
VRLLLEENLSPRLVEVLSRAFPGSRHVEHLGLRARPDREIWEHAAREEFALVSKDNDFRQLSFLHGAPPKVVWLSVGDASTEAIAKLLSKSEPRILAFLSDPEESPLILERPPDAEA